MKVKSKDKDNNKIIMYKDSIISLMKIKKMNLENKINLNNGPKTSQEGLLCKSLTNL